MDIMNPEVQEGRVFSAEKKKSKEKKFLTAKRKDAHTVLGLACKDCGRSTNHFLTIPSKDKPPMDLFDFSHFCVDCDSFAPLVLA